MREHVVRIAALVAGAVGLVLLIACANVANQLWNQNHVDESYAPEFLDRFVQLVAAAEGVA